MKKTAVYILNVLFIILIAVLTVNLLFRDRELSEIIDDVDRADKLWVLLGAALTFGFVAGESLIIRYMLRLFGVGISFLRCLKYSFIGFFYSYITPSSSGGQPAQIYYMKKDGIKVGHSTLIMVIVTIAYKTVLVVFGTVFFLLESGFVLEHVGGWIWLLLAGYQLNILYISALLLAFFKPLTARKLAAVIIDLLCRMHILRKKKREAYFAKLCRITDTYSESADYLKTHIRAAVKIFLMTCVQRLLLFAVSWAVYRSFGLTGTGIVGIITIQTMIALAVEMLPLPGAAGITEACFIGVFGTIFTEQYVRSGLLLSRGLTFYGVLIAGAAVTLYAHLRVIKNKADNGGESRDRAA